MIFKRAENENTRYNYQELIGGRGEVYGKL
jgi:hypothetical protein